MELNSVKRIFFISHRMGRTKSRKTAHKCSSDSSDDGGAGLIPYRTAKTFTIFVKCFDCFLLRKTAKFVVDFHCVNVCFVKKIQMQRFLKISSGGGQYYISVRKSVKINATQKQYIQSNKCPKKVKETIKFLLCIRLTVIHNKHTKWQCYIARYP